MEEVEEEEDGVEEARGVMAEGVATLIGIVRSPEVPMSDSADSPTLLM